MKNSTDIAIPPELKAAISSLVVDLDVIYFSGSGSLEFMREVQDKIDMLRQTFMETVAAATTSEGK